MVPRVPPLVQLLADCREGPVVEDDVLTDLCPQLEAVILQRMTASKGRSMASLNVGGWKSQEDFFNWQDPAVQQLHQYIVERMHAKPVGWAMVNRAGSEHKRHQHRIALLSGVFFVTAGGDGEQVTPTIYEGPDKRESIVDPHPGRLVITRGECWHWVPKCVGDLPRITVAFDIRR